MSITLKASYTYRGKEHTATISHYCPICRKKMQLTKELILGLRTSSKATENIICCSASCTQEYKKKWEIIDRHVVGYLNIHGIGKLYSYVLPLLDELQIDAMNKILKEKSEGGVVSHQ